MREIAVSLVLLIPYVSQLGAAEPKTSTDQVAANTFQAKDYSKLKSMPGFSEELLTMHFKLYEGYVKNANLLKKLLKELANEGNDKSPEYAGLKRMYGWEYDGMRLHEDYFDNLGGAGGQPEVASPLYQAMVKGFGSYEAWKKDFIATGLMRGIGWAILYFDAQNGQLTNAWINEHDLGHLAGNRPLLVMDVFEHAYIPKFGLDRAAYIDVFFRNVNWPLVAERFAKYTQTN